MIGLGSPFVSLSALPMKMSLAVDVFCREARASTFLCVILHDRQVQRVRAAADRTPSAMFDRVGNCFPFMILSASPPERRYSIVIAHREQRSAASGG